ncbi:hypothetical protein [Brevibacterium luteolum]|uniref:Uncharacterized protein n=1 Tax=Brevibacterium luteolum TaxID=199591 RepID=A0A2N6PIH9_9MICO|nr:hypothetical protein [Brevibacterium luteolum]PMB98474.1 hypothetical protein CJ198_03800 [Brevibacterium luteolum]
MTVHIRQKARPRGETRAPAQFNYGMDDPQPLTLCDVEATTLDTNWAAARSPKRRVYVSRERCLEIRLDDELVKL